ncbi:glycosyltransferase [Clostridium psychrophilum]|uniref:glycosyltransferase n=1 Tax=Clostridium psychrophilum TaxID=132926 RepID=UPI001C0BCDC9|nr:glycosyltransferase [Clostridium psychrophilum]MBU3179825.1 glycosyltransferase [Clostridium psychrophilum]
MQNPLISIIVPIYKVEAYIKNCLDSILSQTYKNLEVILVDDGSPDNCGNVCEEYSRKDKRVKVIHKKNGGLSSARNAGLDIAIGEYIGFIDSDDWIENDMYESLYNALIKYNADISVCGRYIVQGSRITTISDSEKALIFTRREALSELVLDEYSGMKNFAWDKLYKKELFEDIRYPEGKYFEDIFTTYKLFSKSEKIVDIKSPKYYYLLRGDSICGSNTARKRYDYYDANIRCLEYIKSLEPLLSDMCDKQMFNRIHFCLNDILSLDYKKNDFVMEINEILTKLNGNYFSIKNSNQMGLKQKLSLMLICKYPNLYTIIYPRHKLLKTKITNLLKSIIPKKVINKIEYHKQYENGYKETKHMYETKDDKNYIFLVGTPNHGNLGDQAIVYAENKILGDNFKNHTIIEINTADLLKNLKSLKVNAKKDDIFVLHGGGNLGNEYFWEEEARRKIISEFKDNKIILFPQSIYFKDTENGKNELEKTKTIYNQHKDFTIIAREETSYSIMKEAFPNNNVIMTPDIVMYLNKTNPVYHRSGALLSLRKDREGVLTQEQKDEIKNDVQSNFDKIIITDTVAECKNQDNQVLEYMVNKNQREKQLNKKWDQFKKVELVITDRLHGMVFCAITSTPCIVIANYNHKVKDTYAWLKDLNYIRFVDDIDEIPSLIKELKNIKVKEYDNSFAMKNYEKIIEIMK